MIINHLLLVKFQKMRVFGGKDKVKTDTFAIGDAYVAIFSHDNVIKSRGQIASLTQVHVDDGHIELTFDDQQVGDKCCFIDRRFGII